MVEPVMTAAGRAWMAGELPASEFFAMVRRRARWDRWAPRGWRRLRGVRTAMRSVRLPGFRKEWRP